MGFIDASPLVVFFVSLPALLASAWGAALLQQRFDRSAEPAHQDINTILAATLTLLGLIISFTFAMAVSRYDMRKNYEEAEANAIGTEYLRAELLSAVSATQLHTLLRDYTAQRVLFYTTRDEQQLAGIDRRTSALQTQLWEVVRAEGTAHPSVPAGLALAGMNDVINSQGYTQAAWWNRIPRAAWLFMCAIALVCNVLLGYNTTHLKSRRLVLSILPLVVAIAFFLIADIDAPRHGLIRVHPDNLLALAASLH
jgi:hypothetical protein